MARHSHTRGQLIATVKQKYDAGLNANPEVFDNRDIPENVPFINENPLVCSESSEFVSTILSPGSALPIQGILWIKASPALENAARIQFDVAAVEKNMKSCMKIYESICKNFAPKYSSMFTSSVMHNWESWLQTQRQTWNLEHPQLDEQSNILRFPRAQSERTRNALFHRTDGNVGNSVEDCALADLSDDVEFLTHSSGQFGSFTKTDRLQMVRLTLAQVEEHNKKFTVVQNMGCIFKFSHVDRKTQMEKTQIAVGMVEKMHNCLETNAELFDIRFCPPKGAKPASKGRPDTLYQDISADYAYNLGYKSRQGKKVEKEDVNLPRSVFLAFNLEINKDGKFCKKRRNDSPYNMSSYSLADNVITEYYRQSKSNAV